MKRLTTVFAVFMLCCCILFAKGAVERQADINKTVQFTDSCGRTVELPAEITKAAPSGNVATMMFSCIAPEYMCNMNSELTAAQAEYLPKSLQGLPATGQLYGSKAVLNYEELIATGAQVLVDLGDYKKGIAEDLDALQAQTGIPCIFIEADLAHMAQAFRTLGLLLDGKKERGEEIANFIEEALQTAERCSARIKDNERVSVMFSSLSKGLGTNAKGSTQAQVLELVGAENAIVTEKITSKGGGTLVSIEQVYAADPDVIIFSEQDAYENAATDPAWKEIRAIKEGRYYLVPTQPYNWLSNPPSLNMVLGIYWLGNLLYPQYFDYDIAAQVKRIYKVFWDYDLSPAQTEAFLRNARQVK